ncbi:c-type cytochrome biogenesis protein CcsB [Bacillus sp. REN10]|uniref:c-type cytochrome biogenesis protein CcsB n=1 Tax=Bacillus sp. REN10 TaxID=2782541 RepID=UPI00193B2D8D
MIQWSSTSLYISFILYLIAIIPLALSVKSKKSLFAKIGISLTAVGFVLQIVYFITRWYAAGHAPVSNLYEFMTFFGIMLVGSFLIIYFMYRQPVIGLFVLPIALLVLGYANAFSKDVSPLIPALQSEWLTIHVITVAFASSVLSISFITGVIYLLKTIDPQAKGKRPFFLELVMYFLVVVVGFITITTTFNVAGYSKYMQFENQKKQAEVAEYTLPAITAPNNAIVVNKTGENEYEETKQQSGLMEIPASIDAKKLNTVLWSFFTGTILYVLIRLITRKRIFTLLSPWTSKVNADLMDEISYRAIVVGFPLFALGGLAFAMIWAQMAWSRFWGWDPKEVWALITFLFYAALLHLRLGRGWEGEKTAWMAIVGFGIIMFNQVFVNLVISGLHSYA